MHRVKHLGGLINQRDRRSDRCVLLALAHCLLGRAANPHARLVDIFHQRHKAATNVLIRQRHNGLADRHTASLDQRSATRRHTEDVGVLPRTRVGIQKAGEVCVHTSIKHFAPRCRQRIGRIA